MTSKQLSYNIVDQHGWKRKFVVLNSIFLDGIVLYNLLLLEGIKQITIETEIEPHVSNSPCKECE